MDLKHQTERLGLDDIDALAQDVLTRAGCALPAAAAVAWAIRRSERDGDRAGGLDRLPRLLEAVRMGAISVRARPAIRQEAAARLSVDADHGFCDAAMDAAFGTFVELATSHGIAAVTVSRTGDAPMPRPWIRRLAGQGILGLAIADPEAQSASFPTIAPSHGDFRIEGLAKEMLVSMTGENSRSETTGAVPLTPCEGRMCVLAITAPDGAGRDRASGVSDRQTEADITGVDVSSELLARVLS